jgi:hypothetical protein
LDDDKRCFRDTPKIPGAEEALSTWSPGLARGRLKKECTWAIGNVPPREAVSTVAGREKVIGWVKYLENFESRRAHIKGTQPYDFTWVWHELGVLEERR